MKPLSASFIACLSALLFICPNLVLAQQVPQNRKWIAQDPKYVEYSSAGIRFLPRSSKDGTNNVKTTLHLTSGQPWRVAFDIQMVPTAGSGMSIHLRQGTTELCWLGAGDYYKSISGFLGTGNANMPFSQTWDDNWHSFAYESDGKTLSLWHNGSKCGEVTLAGTPDTLTIQSVGMELRVRRVRVGKLPKWDTSTVNIPYFTENFINPKFIEHWNGSNNGGSVTIGEKGLKLEGNGKGYPVLASQSNPFPSNGNWTASFGYHYSSVGNYGTEIRCNRSNGDAVLLVHQDVHGQFLTLNSKTVWRSSPDTQWHVISLVENDNQITAYMDGGQVGKDVAGNRPVSFRIGGGLLDNPWDWSNLEIAFMKVNVGVHPLNLSALNERTNLLQPLIHSTLSVASIPQNAPAFPVTPPVPTVDTELSKLNEQIDEHNALVAEGNKFEALKSRYIDAYQECKLNAYFDSSGGRQNSYYDDLRRMEQYSNLFDVACVHSAFVSRQAALLRSIIEANPLYAPAPQANSTNISVSVTVHTEH